MIVRASIRGACLVLLLGLFAIALAGCEKKVRVTFRVATLDAGKIAADAAGAAATSTRAAGASATSTRAAARR